MEAKVTMPTPCPKDYYVLDSSSHAAMLEQRQGRVLGMQCCGRSIYKNEIVSAHVSSIYKQWGYILKLKNYRNWLEDHFSAHVHWTRRRIECTQPNRQEYRGSRRDKGLRSLILVRSKH
ncbi:hypothetical protein EJB05_14000, partial [Eragrostis curvula]